MLGICLAYTYCDVKCIYPSWKFFSKLRALRNNEVSLLYDIYILWHEHGTKVIWVRKKPWVFYTMSWILNSVAEFTFIKFTSRLKSCKYRILFWKKYRSTGTSVLVFTAYRLWNGTFEFHFKHIYFFCKMTGKVIILSIVQ